MLCLWSSQRRVTGGSRACRRPLPPCDRAGGGDRGGDGRHPGRGRGVRRGCPPSRLEHTGSRTRPPATSPRCPGNCVDRAHFHKMFPDPAKPPRGRVESSPAYSLREVAAPCRTGLTRLRPLGARMKARQADFGETLNDRRAKRVAVGGPVIPRCPSRPGLQRQHRSHMHDTHAGTRVCVNYAQATHVHIPWAACTHITCPHAVPMQAHKCMAYMCSTCRHTCTGAPRVTHVCVHMHVGNSSGEYRFGARAGVIISDSFFSNESSSKYFNSRCNSTCRRTSHVSVDTEIVNKSFQHLNSGQRPGVRAVQVLYITHTPSAHGSPTC